MPQRELNKYRLALKTCVSGTQQLRYSYKRKADKNNGMNVIALPPNTA
jgi:hypothetical protein